MIGLELVSILFGREDASINQFLNLSLFAHHFFFCLIIEAYVLVYTIGSSLTKVAKTDSVDKSETRFERRHPTIHRVKNHDRQKQDVNNDEDCHQVPEQVEVCKYTEAIHLEWILNELSMFSVYVLLLLIHEP